MSRYLLLKEKKKLLAVKSLDYFKEKAVVSVPGCWNWTGQKTGKLIGPWKEIPWLNRRVVFVFDSDYFSKPTVYAPYNKFAKQLLLEGARVDMIDLRDDKNDEKNGADDFIVKYGEEKFIKRVQNPFWKHHFSWDNFSQRWNDRQGRSDEFIMEELEAKILKDELAIEEGLNIIKKNTGVGKGITRSFLKEIRSRWDKLSPSVKSKEKSSRELELDRGEKGPRAFFQDLASQYLDGDENLFYLTSEKALVSIDRLSHKQFYIRNAEEFRFHYSQKIDFIQYTKDGKSDGYELLPAH